MAISVNTPSCGLWNLKKPRETQLTRWSWGQGCSSRSRVEELSNANKPGLPSAGVKASCFFNPTNKPILKDALREPVAFMGGMFAGLLRLDLNEDPLKEWVTKTVDASGLTEEDIDAEGSKPEEEVPQQIEIE